VKVTYEHELPMKITFRFYEELNDYLAEGCRKRDLEVKDKRSNKGGEVIEPLGVMLEV